MISCAEMKAIEDKAEDRGISKLDLMENAGKGVADLIIERYKPKGKRILVVCYHGNNGGDGMVAANYLADKGDVEVLFLGEEEKLKPEAKVQFDKLEKNVLIQFISLEYVHFDDYDIIIDAILGIGLEGELKPILQSTIDHINKSKAKKISVDVPTGINADTGEDYGTFVDADLVVTFHDLKTGLKKWKSKTEVIGIGIPK